MTSRWYDHLHSDQSDCSPEGPESLGSSHPAPSIGGKSSPDVPTPNSDCSTLGTPPCPFLHSMVPSRLPCTPSTCSAFLPSCRLPWDTYTDATTDPCLSPSGLPSCPCPCPSRAAGRPDQFLHSTMENNCPGRSATTPTALRMHNRGWQAHRCPCCCRSCLYLIVSSPQRGPLCG